MRRPWHGREIEQLTYAVTVFQTLSVFPSTGSLTQTTCALHWWMWYVV